MNSVSLNERSYLFCATGVDEINAGKSFVASPNPGTDNLTLRAKQNFYNAEIKLFDSIGKEILKGTFSGSSADFNTTHLTPGVYTYEIILGNNVTRGKWIKAGN
ncbi:MAG: T9SS type A sorting domain-containing protein [Bacteroidetes bacterium]|nr:T9SS type A sorting domain-containing protein [Bacteroidota bacterium]